MSKAAEYEVIHGRWAMLAIPGIVAQEQATGIPWYDAGALCTPASCLENYTFPGAPAPLAPEGSGLPLLGRPLLRGRLLWALLRRTVAASPRPQGLPLPRRGRRLSRRPLPTPSSSPRRVTSRSSSSRSLSTAASRWALSSAASRSRRTPAWARRPNLSAPRRGPLPRLRLRRLPPPQVNETNRNDRGRIAPGWVKNLTSAVYYLSS